MKQIEIIKSLLAGFTSIEQMGIARFGDKQETTKFFGLEKPADLKPNTDYLYSYGEKMYTSDNGYMEPDLSATDKEGQIIHFYEVDKGMKEIKKETEDLLDWCRSSMETHNEGRRAMARECFGFGCRIMELIEKKEEEK